ncbi:MAG: hypothetical protein KME31_05680 [Tolypothrix carrinoi HA7290-LM1]|nr:hypothetical protein [Tolypothrix carrinoi HA7290-LM1]
MFDFSVIKSSGIIGDRISLVYVKKSAIAFLMPLLKTYLHHKTRKLPRLFTT